MLHYDCISQIRSLPDYGTYTAYGIVAYGNGNVHILIPDIAINKDRVEQLVGICNRLQPDPIHLHDIVEDFLAED